MINNSSNFKALLTITFICFLTIGCSGSEQLLSNEEYSSNEKIVVEVNEAIEFNFYKKDNKWAGLLNIYTFSDNDQKVLDRQFTSQNDSTWNDFQQFVDHLEIYSLDDQSEIDGWVPNSSFLPKRVYSFTIRNETEVNSYSYQDPENELRDYWQSQNIVMFITYIENDLNWVSIEE